MGQRRNPDFLRLAFLSPQLTVFLQSYFQHIQEMHQHENGLIAKDQVYTTVSPHDKNSNGHTLTLKVDQTFNCRSDCHAWDSSSISWNWDYVYIIDGVWSYDKATKTITLKASKYNTYVDLPVSNISGKVTNGLLDRAVSTPNFDLESSKEINCFKVNNWDQMIVEQGKLPRK